MEVESILEIFIICLSSICILRSYSVLHNSTNSYFLIYVGEFVRKCVSKFVCLIMILSQIVLVIEMVVIYNKT